MLSFSIKAKTLNVPPLLIEALTSIGSQNIQQTIAILFQNTLLVKLISPPKYVNHVLSIRETLGNVREFVLDAMGAFLYNEYFLVHHFKMNIYVKLVYICLINPEFRHGVVNC